MKDRNEWFEEVERAYSKLKIVERPYAPPHAAVAVEAEDVLCCLGLHPHISASDWLVINMDEVSELIGLIRPVPVTGSTSDGYHTFDELYHHRAVLFSVIVATFRGRSWKSLHHHDGTMYDGMFIVGIDTPAGPATYHYDVEPYWDMFPCEVLDRAPEWDGHTPDDAIERIGTLRDILQAENQRGTRRLSQRLVRRDRRRRRDGDRLHRGHQVLPVLRRGALGERGLCVNEDVSD